MDPAAGTGISSCGVVGAGAAAGKVAAAAVAPGPVVRVPVVVAVAPPAGAPAAAKPALNWKNLRRRWAQTHFVLGYAAAALGFFSIRSSSSTATAGLLGSCAPTDAEAAALRAASKHLLVNAGVLVLAATTALLVPAARQVGNFLSFAGWLTGYRAAGVLLKLFVECHGHADAVVMTCYIVLEVVTLLGYLVGSAVIVNSSY